MINKDLFKYGQRYTLDQMVELAGDAGLLVTDCSSDDYPNYTIAQEDSDPIFQFTPVSDEFLTLTWTDWDEPDTGLNVMHLLRI